MSDTIDRQAAIDAIMASASKYTGFMEMELYTADDAVEAIKAVPTASPWHRVEEELPEIGKRVLVSYGGDVQILKRTDSMTYGGKNYWWNEADGLWERVEEGSYWMPIEPPKEDV